MPKKENQSIKLLRHQLGSIDLNDLSDEKEMSETERINYCSQIFAVFPLLEKDIKKMLYQQLMFLSNNAENWEQVIFGRGTFNGMDLLYEKWSKANSEYKETNIDKENFNKNSPISEI